MASYFDSSAILEVLLGRPRSEAVVECWEADRCRTGSILLEAESVTVLRRVAKHLKLKLEAPLVKKRLAALDTYLEAMVIREVDRDVVDVVRRTPSLANCRSLDALHLATAILFRQNLDEPLEICALDERMRVLAATLDFAVTPRT